MQLSHALINITKAVLIIPYLAPGIVIVKNALSFDVFNTSAASYNLESDSDKDVIRIIKAWGNVQYTEAIIIPIGP